MSNLREAALQRLTNMQQEMEHSIKLLEAALSAQPEPAAPQPAGPEDMAVYAAIAANYKAAPTEPAPGWCKHCRQYTIEEPLPAAPPVAEPVAWINEHGHIDRGLDAILDPTGWTPLYTHPPRTALTDAELERMYNAHASYQECGPLISGWFDFARAVEAAIKEKQND